MRGVLLKDQYRLDSPLGSGGMGAVWLARDIHLDRPVAVKVLHAALGAETDDARIRFHREARIAARLSGHHHIVSIHDFGYHRDPQERDVPFVVMEYLSGALLSELIARPSRLTIDQVVEWCAQICDALAAAHDTGIIHRDIKPANIMVLPEPDGDGVVKVLDFGAAAYTDTSRTRITRTGYTIGTAAYMAPEQAEYGRVLDARTDLYALGCLLYDTLTGEPPFGRGAALSLMWAHANTAPTPPSAHRGDIPDALNRLTLDLLAKSPDDRPQAAREVRDALLGMRAVIDRTARTASVGSGGGTRLDADPLSLLAGVVRDAFEAGAADTAGTLDIRFHHATLTGKLGNHAQAAHLLAELAQAMARVLGPDHAKTLTSRHKHALYVGDAGDNAEAARLFALVVTDRARVLGPDHPDTLHSRHQHAWYTGRAGDPAEAARLYAELTRDRIRVSGPDHSRTLASRHQHAWYLGLAGDAAEAAKLFTAVALDRDRVLGPDHPDTLSSRHQHAWYTGRAGQHAEAARLLADVAHDRLRILGPDHPDTLLSRHTHAYQVGKTGDRALAAQLFTRVAGDRVRVLGRDHPDTLISLRRAAEYGDAARR